ncbi:hypothetical protein Cpap_0336 [Ruminiclostridium papyrosolvens DSM 2782]|uniref:Uncharacterized protein n=1 Tax=Ruminiclostridium papyrosolvens DSM 2782 TaxID=588581 RepID=F1TGR6_9FIRM|nr:hypothetical protein [Ruminiclostridium papyrosolvens]EGD46397.1 hypothetical protein Cpap_0336 [Ruminiclostridium papyrosolvens DSM 2782]WES33990.1 hypothetical protein P0092_19860 [Ruminiclostridium papyrosolvens DSM 2782]
MWNIFNKKNKAHGFDLKVLFKNDISLLTLDERWNGLFKNMEKTNDITECENRIKELLKEQSRLITETKDISIKKKECMDSIIRLTTEVFDKNNKEAHTKMQECEKSIVAINKKMEENEERLLDIPKEIREENLQLLEYTVKLVYFSIRENQLRVSELDKEIAEAKEKLKKMIEERELLAEDYSDTYSYFHDLLGKDELQKLDEIYFSK